MAERGEIRAWLEAWRLAVMREPDLAARAKVVAVVLSAHLNVEVAEIGPGGLSGDIYPGIDRIAAHAAQSRRTAAEGVAELRRAGFLKARRRSHNSNFYTLTLPTNMQVLAHHDVQNLAHHTPSDMQVLAHQSPSDVRNRVERCANVRAVTCEISHSNLGFLTSEENLFGLELFERFRRQLGGHTDEWVWKDAKWRSPNTIVFATSARYHRALSIHSQKLAETGLMAAWDEAA
jgi:hypothetical protein